MQSMLWLLHILIVFQISMHINCVDSESNHPSINFKWWRKNHNKNTHQHLIKEMSPDQYNHFQEEYNDNQIPLRHQTKYAKIDRFLRSRIGNNGASSVRNYIPSKEDLATDLPKYREPEIESKLRNIRRSRPRMLSIDNEAPVVEDLNDFAAMPTNRSHLQEVERRNQNEDDLSPVSKNKMKEAGNRTLVDQMFKKVYKTSPPLLPLPVNKEEERRKSRLAEAHFSRATEETQCKIPTPIIIRVSEYYPRLHTFYVPPCTKLFKCTEKSGCCAEPKRCLPLKTENVTLYFKVHTAIQGGGNVVKAESLTFQNDTECRCQPVPTSNASRDNSYWDNLDIEPQDEFRSECTCPAPYMKRTMNNETCVCDCFHNDKPCLNHKMGGLVIKQSEKKCVEEGICTKPTCEYGNYSVKSGKCPKSPHYLRQN